MVISDPSSGGMSNYTIKVIRMSPLIVIKVVMVIGIIDPPTIWHIDCSKVSI